ncbi:MAG: sulfatase-like hydrolase/transferase [Planctomycetaceae bacterium]|nr:sulfatase-like hydrolase/transferase [Planctomycetaceae bacterium]
MIRKFCLLTARLAVFPFFLGIFVIASNGGLAAEQKPNILFLFADDQCYDTIHALGNEEIETPNLDRLVKDGTTFTHCYNMGGWNGAICVASRTMLNTGRYLWHANDVWKTSKQEREQGRWWSEYMKKAGYQTYMTGKWHVNAAAEQSFHQAAHVRGGMPNQTPQGYDRPKFGEPDTWSPYDESFGGFWAGGRHWSEVVADDAIGFLKHAQAQEKPFFMYIAFNAPHDPRQAPKSFIEKYRAKDLAIPASFQPEYPYKDGMGCSEKLRDEHLAPFPRTEYAVEIHRQEYYAIITHLDEQIGRILNQLEETGKRDSTWIVFTADHGLAVGHHGLIGKQNMYDHSVRVPFMIIGPGVEAGQKIDIPIYLQDVMPTTLELAGVEKPDHVEFHSLLPLLRGEQTEGSYDAIYGAYVDRQRMVTMDGYKLILYPKISVARLYHVAEDPHELHDLLADGKTHPMAAKLFARLLKLQTETGDTLDLTSVYPNLVGD